MPIPTTSEKNLRALLQRLNDCSFDVVYSLYKTADSKWYIMVGKPTDTWVLCKPLTTHRAIIALCVTLETMTSIRDKSFDDGYQSAVLDAQTPGRGEG